MKRISVLAVLTAFFISSAWMLSAAEYGTISVTVSLQSSVAITVSPDTWSIGAKALSDVVATDALDPDGYFTATNTGNVTVNMTIKGADGAGGWAIGTTQGADTFTLKADVEPVTTPNYDVTLTATDTTLKSSVTPYTDNAVKFNLQYGTPSSDTKGAGVSQGFNVTVTASAL